MNYHHITYPDMNNGDGLRVVLWISGCSHHCKGCQNPQTWDPDSGIKFDNAAKEEIFNQLKQDYISGITFSGGDPLHEDNLDCVLDLIGQIKNMFPSKTIWLYSGFTWEDIYENQHNKTLRMRQDIVQQCDIFVDGKFEAKNRDLSLQWIGSSNQRVIDIKQSLYKGKMVLHQ